MLPQEDAVHEVPVVIHKLNRLAAHGATKKELQKSLKAVRANPERTRVA